MSSIFLYPSLCLFEGTVVSVGRGTASPFQIIGHPDFHHGDTTFTPKSGPGASAPKLEGKLCEGFYLKEFGHSEMPRRGELYLFWLLNIYEAMPNKEEFFLENGFFDLLAGTDKLRQQIIEGKKEQEIRESWQKELKKFKEMRRNYLLYDDFE